MAAGSGADLPLVEGDEGESVVDVQRRLRLLGFDPLPDPDGRFARGTRAAVEAFQRQRGLRVDGMCGTQTWGTLVEAGYRPGDRLLYRRAPMQRGDDVAEVQRRLCALGFDTGRVDGIFGEATAAAVHEFQENAGLPADGIVGTATLAELRRVQARQPDQALVSTVRARELLRHSPPTLSGRRVAVGEVGGLGAVSSALRRRLAALGARVTSLHHPDDALQSRLANAARVEVYIGLRLDPDRAGCLTSFYSGYRDESVGGRALAHAVQRTIPAALGIPDRGSRGMSVTILRETQMPSVVVEVGPAAIVVERGRALADGLAASLVSWAVGPWD